jgi:hypothetical protein
MQGMADKNCDLHKQMMMIMMVVVMIMMMMICVKENL